MGTIYFYNFLILLFRLQLRCSSVEWSVRSRGPGLLR